MLCALYSLSRQFYSLAVRGQNQPNPRDEFKKRILLLNSIFFYRFLSLVRNLTIYDYLSPLRLPRKQHVSCITVVLG